MGNPNQHASDPLPLLAVGGGVGQGPPPHPAADRARRSATCGWRGEAGSAATSQSIGREQRRAWTSSHEARALSACRRPSCAASSRGVPTFAVGPDGTTPLHWAVRAGDVDAVKRLLHDGANATAANRYGVTPLSLAAENGDAATIDALLAAGADANGVAARAARPMLMTAPRAAAIAAAIDALVAHGAHVNAQEQRARRDGADLGGGGKSRRRDRGARRSRRRRQRALERRRSSPRRDYGDGKSGRFTVLPRGGWTPLMYAARQDARDALRALVDGARRPQRDGPRRHDGADARDHQRALRRSRRCCSSTAPIRTSPTSAA